MKAKCPHCGDGFSKCVDGYTEAFFASGTVWTRHCNVCGEDNGGHIRDGNGPPVHGPGRCVWCGSPEVVWMKIGHTDEMDLDPCPRTTTGT